jgi:hypothetical protein
MLPGATSVFGAQASQTLPSELGKLIPYLPPYAIWTVTFDPSYPSRFFTLQADNGKFMKRCHDCARWGSWPIPDMMVVTGSATERPAQILYLVSGATDLSTT